MRKSVNYNESDMMSALLEAFEHPCWLEKKKKIISCNPLGNEYLLSNSKKEGIVYFRDKKYYVKIKELNHGTNLVLKELIEINDSFVLEQCTKRINSALELIGA